MTQNILNKPDEIMQTSDPQFDYIIKAGSDSLLDVLRDVWRFRELLGFMIWRDFTGRYRQTVLGIGWAIINPFIQMIVFSIIFGGIAKLDSNGVPYPILTYTALVPWTFFSSSLAGAINSIVSNAGMIKKVYFPRMIYPIQAVVTRLPDFFLSFSLLILLSLFYGIPLTWRLLLLPLFLLYTIFIALSIGLWLAPLNVKFRDVRHASSFMISIMMWLTPVAYSINVVNEEWRLLYALNPIATVTEGFRWMVLGQAFPPIEIILTGFTVTTCLFITGILYFNRTESNFADIA